MVEERRDNRPLNEILLTHEREIRNILISHEKELRKQEAESLEKALALQASEYERRLTALNHEYARADQVQHTFLPRETFASFEKTDREWKDAVNKALAESRGATNRIAFIGAGLAIITLLWRLMPMIK